MACKHFVQVLPRVYLLAVVEVELPNQFLVAAEVINPLPTYVNHQPCQKWQGWCVLETKNILKNEKIKIFCFFL